MVNTISFPKLVFTVLLFALSSVALSQSAVEDYTYTLTQSTKRYTFWTTLPSEKVFKNSQVPSLTGSDVKVYAARNEFEPFKIVINPSSSGSVTVSVGDLGGGIEVEIFQVKYVNITQNTDYLGQAGEYPDPLWPLESGDSFNVVSGENTALWFSVKVPKTAASGGYFTNVNISGVNIPVYLHVFNFQIPEELHVKSNVSVSVNNIISKYGVPFGGNEFWEYVDRIKQFMIDHRLTPQTVAWPGSLTTGGGRPSISYDCDGILSDNDGEWGFEQSAARYIDGTGKLPYLENNFNDGAGFPSFLIEGISNNSESDDQRPAEFCGITRSASDWVGGSNPNTAYNQKWFEYITALQNYLVDLGYIDEAYFRISSSLYAESDYEAIAWYSQELKKAAGQLKLMVGECPDARIYDNPLYAEAKVDIWLADLLEFSPSISLERQAFYNEETWLYWSNGAKPPFFHPSVIDHPGVEGKYAGWFLWKYRLRGLSLFLNNWSNNPWESQLVSGVNGLFCMLYPPSQTGDNIWYGSNGHRFVPSIRLELLRDSLEDFEYLYVLNGNQIAEADSVNVSDDLTDLIIGGVNYYNRDSNYIYNIRKWAGMKIGGEIISIPELPAQAGHPRANGEPSNYYINFQDPEGQPYDEPLVIGGDEYIKAGWDHYDSERGFGWYGDNSQGRYAYSTGDNDLQKSILYDDYGRVNVFEFDLPDGVYNVTVSVGWNGRSYSHQKVEIEGVNFIDDEATIEDQPFIVRTREVEVKDKKLSMSVGIRNEYTMLNYLKIELPEECSPWDFDCDGKVNIADTAMMAGMWNMTGEDEDWDQSYDLLSDEIIDIADFSILVEHWLEGCSSETGNTLE